MSTAMGMKTVPLWKRIAWGCGGWADNYLFNVINILFLFVYVDYLKMPPALAGVALCIPRVLDALTDPMIGNWSDNFQSRWGRRRPLIVIGAILSAILLPLYFLPLLPSTAGNPWYSNAPFWHVAILGSLHALTYTLFVVPYTALGYELSEDYDERTRILSWRMYLGLAGQALVPWIYQISTDRRFFDNIQQGAVTVSILAGVIIVVLGCLPAMVCKENPKYQQQEKIRLGRAIVMAFSNRAYVLLLVGFIIVLSSQTVVASIGTFMGLFYICRGDELLNGKIVGWGGTITAVASMFSLYLISWLSRRIDKKWAFISGMGVVALSQISYIVTITPEHPYWILISLFIFGLSIQGSWLMLDSMLSDICDEEELKSGRRSEGIFSSVRGFIQKASGALTTLVSGILLEVIGYDPNVARSTGLSEQVLFNMKFLYIAIPTVGCLIGVVIFYFYPITRARALATRQQLDARSSSAE